MNKEIIKYLKNSIDEKGNYCYSLPVETTKAVIKELNRLNNIIDELEKLVKDYIEIYDVPDTDFICAYLRDILDKLKELKENNNE